jgi:hypothetical protein
MFSSEVFITMYLILEKIERKIWWWPTALQEYLDGELDNKVSYFFSCYKIMVLNFKAMENAQMKQQKVMVVWQCGHSKRGIMLGNFNLYKQVGVTILIML